MGNFVKLIKNIIQFVYKKYFFFDYNRLIQIFDNINLILKIYIICFICLFIILYFNYC